MPVFQPPRGRLADGQCSAGETEISRAARNFVTTRHRPRQVEPKAEGELAKVKPPVWMNREPERTLARNHQGCAKGVLRRAARQTFINYVVSAERFERGGAGANPDRCGGFYTTARGADHLALYPDHDECAALMTRLGAELGFSPTARARLGQPQAPPDTSGDNSAWASLKRFPVIAVGKGKAS